MSNKKISALTSATTPLAGTEVLPIVQGGVTKQVSIANLTAGRTVDVGSLSSAGAVKLANGQQLQWNTSGGTPAAILKLNASNNVEFGDSQSSSQAMVLSNGTLTITNGNLVQGAAAKGVNFTANTPAAGMTSQLLNWYEEGTWTPVVAGATTAGTYTYAAQAGSYTRIGRQVSVWCSLQNITASSAGTGTITIKNLPFTIANDTAMLVGAPSPLYIRQLAASVTGAKGTFTLPIKNTTTVYCVYFDGATTVDFTCADISSGATDIGFQLTYYV